MRVKWIFSIVATLVMAVIGYILYLNSLVVYPQGIDAIYSFDRAGRYQIHKGPLSKFDLSLFDMQERITIEPLVYSYLYKDGVIYTYGANGYMILDTNKNSLRVIKKRNQSNGYYAVNVEDQHKMKNVYQYSSINLLTSNTLSKTERLILRELMIKGKEKKEKFQQYTQYEDKPINDVIE